jgi:hypothetical protein
MRIRTCCFSSIADIQIEKCMTRIVSRRPADNEFSFDGHRMLVQRLAGSCALKLLSDQMYWLCELASHLSTEQIDKVHRPYSWTVRQVFEHCVDVERFLGMCLLRCAAGDLSAVRGFNHEAYAESRFGLGNFSGLVSELGHQRQANLLLLRRIVPVAWERSVEIDGHQLTTRAIAWVAAGHLDHHLSIVEARCGLSIMRQPE